MALCFSIVLARPVIIRSIRRIRSMVFIIEFEQEDDERWLAEVTDLPGTLAYGQTLDEAIARVKALALRVIADRLEHGEVDSDLLEISFKAAKAA